MDLKGMFSNQELREKLANRLARASVWCLRALVFVFPIFVLPWPAMPLESMKAHFVNVLTLIVLLLSTAHLALSSKAAIRFHPLFFGSFGFLFVSLLSGLTSPSRTTGIYGIGGREMWSVVSIFGLTLTTFFLGALTRRKQDFRLLIFVVAAGIAAAGALELMQMSGRFPYPFSWTHQRIWSVLGTPKIFATISGLGAALMLVFLKHEPRKWSKLKLVGALAILIDLWVLLRVDFYGAWILFALGLLLLVITSLLSGSNDRLWDRRVPLGLFLIAVAFTMVGSPIRQNLIPEYQMDMPTSWRVTREGLKGALLLGSGPGTFEFSYSKFRPVEFNSGEKWNTRFDRPAKHFITILATTGVLGLLSWMAQYAFLVFGLIKKVINRNIRDPMGFSVGLLACVPALTSFLFASNFSLVFYGAAMLGLSASALGRDLQVPKMNTFRLRFAGLAAASAIALVAVNLGVFEARAALGEAYLARSASLKLSLAERFNAAGSAMRASTREPRILSVYSRLALQVANEESRAQKVDSTKVQQLLADATASVKKATEIEPADVTNWLALGAVYQNLLPFVGGSGEWVVRAYREALEREPSNPLPRVEMGKSFLTLGDRMKQAEISPDIVQHIYRNAEEELIRALELKADYSPAHFYLGLIYDRQGRVEDAVNKLEAVERFNPSDVGVAYELGRLYLRRGNIEKAELEFRRAVANLPSYSDAHWQLANALLQQRRPTEAIEELQKILQYNPDNARIKEAIEGIKQGRTRL